MGRPPKADRSAVAEITRSLRFTELEIEALDILTERKATELRGTGATVTATSLARALIRRELDATGAYAEAERRRQEKTGAEPAPVQARLPGLEVAPPSAPAPSSTNSTAAPSAPVSYLNETAAPAVAGLRAGGRGRSAELGAAAEASLVTAGALGKPSKPTPKKPSKPTPKKKTITKPAAKARGRR